MNRKGEKAFQKCDVKTVDFTRFFYYVNGDSNQEQVVSEEALDTSKPHKHNGYRGRLRCAKTEDDPTIIIESPYRNHDTQLDATVEVMRLAGVLVCADCRYSSMTAVDVSIARKELADAEAQRLEAYRVLDETRTIRLPGEPTPTIPHDS